MQGLSPIKWVPEGYGYLERATMLIPNDFYACSSLAGVINNVRRDFADAQKMYAYAANISNRYSYTLLNDLKMKALNKGKLDLEPKNE